VQTKLDRISEIAKRDGKCRFNNLMHLLNRDNLKDCFHRLRKDSAVGIDSVTWQEYESNLDERLDDLVARMKRWSYRPQPVRRIYIPKGDGRMRPLGIPAIEDKVVQMATARILTAIYENDFMDFSYGFRPGKGCHDAVERLDYMIKWNRVNYVLDADIKGFFDNMSHKWLVRMLEERVSDTHLLRLLKRFLNNGYLEDGILHVTGQGTPQGGIVSPVLANIYLHYVLDLWFEKIVKKHAKGFVSIVRYADDYVICAQYKDEADAIREALTKRMGKFSLSLAGDKTKLIQFGRFAEAKARRQGKKAETFDFLGFTHYNDKDRKGGFKVGRKTVRKKLTTKARELKLWLKKVRSAKPQLWWPILCAKLRGHYQYYGVSGNYRGVMRYYRLAVQLLYKWLNRRSQKRSMNWTQFHAYLQEYPLPTPRICRNLYVNRSYRGEC